MNLVFNLKKKTRQQKELLQTKKVQIFMYLLDQFGSVTFILMHIAILRFKKKMYVVMMQMCFDRFLSSIVRITPNSRVVKC